MSPLRPAPSRCGPALLVPLLLWASPLSAGGGSVDALVDAVVARARPALERAAELDVAVVVASPWPQLSSDLSDLLVARLRALGVRSAARGDGDAAWARAAGFERVVRLDADVAGGRLRITGNVLCIAPLLWTDEPAELRVHLFADAPLDAELRAYLPSVVTAPAGRWQTRGVPVGDVPLLALDVGDADGDGKIEVVGATASEVLIWRWDGSRFVERRRLRLEGRPASVRPRGELATVSVEGGGFVAHASGLADGLRRVGAAAQPAHGFSFPGLSGACELAPGVDWFTAASCGKAAGGLPERFLSAAALRGGARPARAAVEVGGALMVALGQPDGRWSGSTVAGAGAQVALGVLDRGEVVVTSAPVEPGEPDALLIRGLSESAPLLTRVDHLPGSVRALAVGDIDGDGRAEIVAAVRDDAARRTELVLVN